MKKQKLTKKSQIRKNAKKLLALGMALIISNPVSAIMTQAKSSNDENFDYVTMINRIGVSAVKDDEAFISRGDFTVLALQAMQMNHLTGEMAFDDIEGIQGKYISTAKNLGIVKSSDDGKFYPNKIITREEAVTICLRILGYDKIINGPYPVEYMVKAEQIGLTDNLSAGQNLSCNDASIMLFNMLDSKYIEEVVTNDPENKKYTISENTYMNQHLGIYTEIGTVTSICGLSVNGASSVGKDRISIDSVKYDNPYYTNNKTYLGRTVRYYIAEKGSVDELLYMHDESKLLKIDFKDIESVKGFDTSDSSSDKKSPQLNYWENSNTKTKKASIDYNATVIVNGEEQIAVSNSDFYSPSGRVSLVDGDNNGKYDVIFIERYDYYYVSYITDKTVIADKYGKESIDLSIPDPDNLNIYHGDILTDADSIAPDTVFALACSYNDDGTIDYTKKIEIIVVNATETGVIEQYDENGYFVINGNEYSSLPDITEELRSRLGEQVKLYIGINGVIVDYTDLSKSEGTKYGYLVAMDVGEGLTVDVTFRLLTEKGEMLDVKPSEDFRYTGLYKGSYSSKVALEKEKMAEVITPHQLIKYFLNESGELALMEMPYDHTEETDYVGFDKVHFSMDYKGDNEYLYMNHINENYAGSDISVYFYVNTNSVSAEDFLVGPYWACGYNLGYSSVKVYDASSDSMHAGAVVVENPNATAQDHLSFMQKFKPSVITEKRKALNRHGEPVTQLSLFYNNGLQKLVTVSDNLKPLNDLYFGIETNITKISELEVGDVICCNLDIHGEIYQYVVVNEYDPNHTNNYYRCYSVPYNQNHLADLQYAVGTVTKFVPGSYFMLDSTGKRFNNFRRTALNCYVIDIRTGEATLTRGMTTTLSEGEYVWMQSNRSGVTTVVVYR